MRCLPVCDSTIQVRGGQSGYSIDLNELRERFTRDEGKVRLLLLLSPT